MSLKSVIGGVPSTANASIRVGLSGTQLSRNLVALNDFNIVTDAVGRNFGPGYNDSFARLAVFELGPQDNQTGITTQTYDGVALEEPTVILDYLILQSLTEAYVDRMSPNFSFGTSLMFTSGNDARQFVYSGCILADAIAGDNIARFERAYDSALRATSLVSAASPRFVRLTFRDQVREGYITSFSLSTDANHRNKVSFTFSMFVFNLD